MSDLNQNIDNQLMAYLLGELNQSEIQSIEVWINASTENQTHFEQIKKIWEASSDANIEPFNTTSAWKNIAHEIQPKSFWKHPALKVAAGFALIIGLALSILFWPHSNEINTIASLDKVVMDTLPDHSVISLNRASSIQYADNYNEKTRTVKLQGEAFFEVQPQKEKPFIVELHQARIIVVGTSFNVNSYTENDIIEVFVKTGVIEFTTDTHKTRINAGEKVIYTKSTKEILIDFKAKENGYWRTKILDFDQTPLMEVVSIIEKNYNVKIEFENPELGDCLLTTSFNDASIEEVIAVIQATFSLEVRKQSNTYIFNGSCKAH
jgi:ferric-dicitrate binding protein FerR (iron transport regulator)